MAAAVNLSDELPLPKCPQCGASEYRKAGKNSHNKQPMLKCRKCGRHWTLDKTVDLSIVEKGLKSLRVSGENLIPDGVLCKRCQSPNIRLAGWLRSKSGNTRRARCIDCNKYFACPELNEIRTLDIGRLDNNKRKLDTCPQCGENQIGSGGTNNCGQVLAFCKICSKRWVINPVEREPLTDLTCTNCGQKKDFIKAGIENGLQRYRCQKCLTSFILHGDWVPQCPDCGSMRYKNSGRSIQTGNRLFSCVNCSRKYEQESQPNSINKTGENSYIVDARHLGIHQGHHQAYKIDFSRIRPLWLRESVFKYIKLRLSRGDLKFQTARNYTSVMSRFGCFLEKNYPNIQSYEITRSIMLELFSSDWWLSLSPSPKKRLLFFVSDLLEKLEQYGWGKTSGERLIFREDYPPSKKIQARYIPEFVMDQIIKKLPSLPLPIQRAVLVMAEVGMRFSELSSLKRGCIEQDTNGHWWLNYTQYKLDKDHRVPISKDCAFAIQEQEKFIQDWFGSDFELVFCGRSTKQIWRPKRLTLQVFNNTLQEWVKMQDIRGADGKIWHLTSHQFRHTVATRMINAGIAQHYVQKYLGHETSQMTQHYAHLHDQTLRNAFDEYHDGRAVDIKGTVYEPTQRDIDSSDLQWFRANIQAQALPNGSCSLPTVAQSCPHANACLTCTHFRTSREHLGTHKEELEKTEKILAKAHENGWSRQIEMNEKVAKNLQKIIAALESA